MLQDYLFEPLRKAAFFLNPEKHERWYTQTHLYGTKGTTSGELVYEALSKEQPVMISRLGTSEMHILLNYLSRSKPFWKKLFNYLAGNYPEFWWGHYAQEDIFQSGFFSVSPANLERFAKIYLECLPQIDVLLTWLKGETQLTGYFRKDILKGYIYDAEPYFDKLNPWTRVLEGKKVLVVHPLEKSIKEQYRKRQLLFADLRVLPEFELKVVRAPQTIKGNEHGYSNWFDVLEDVKNKISEQDFDIALIAAGCYGMPLAAHVKSIGKKGVHLGGFLQFMFGIIGGRWKDCGFHKPFINQHWKFPFKEEYPVGFEKQDHGAYW